MTSEQLRDIAAAALLIADGRGNEVEERHNNEQWQPFDGRFQVNSDGAWEYRKRREPKTRYWSKPSDVPLNCWIRRRPNPYGLCQLITAISHEGIFTRESTVWNWSEMSHFEYSTDRKTWLPCTIED